MTYLVEVFREGDAWVADVPALPGAHTFARTLVELRRDVDEVIRLVADLPDDEAVPVEWKWIDLEPTVLQAFELGDLHRQIEQQERQRLSAAAVVAQKLVDAGWPVREIAAMLDLSPGRISQLTRPRNERQSA